jgi:hypothetical protein
LTQGLKMWERQVSARGEVVAVSGVGSKGTSSMTLSGGMPLERIGALQLAKLLLEAPTPLLASLDLRQDAVFLLLFVLHLSELFHSPRSTIPCSHLTFTSTHYSS